MALSAITEMGTALMMQVGGGKGGKAGKAGKGGGADGAMSVANNLINSVKGMPGGGM